tara:strand:- start:579 stop:821 length:243 start_codon:yes stop_codon:yes gene_type:complete
MHSDIDSDTQREVDKIKKTIRVSPTWRGTAQALLLIIDRSESSEDVLWAKKEFIKMGGLIDELIADRKKTKAVLEHLESV